jgi:hypothetical protein
MLLIVTASATVAVFVKIALSGAPGDPLGVQLPEVDQFWSTPLAPDQ